jgi:hypothetical protein
MAGRGLYGIVITFVVVLLCVFIYNRFLAKPGKSIANLGEKAPSA